MNALTFCFLSTTDYDAPQFGSRQQVALELARRGHRLLFVETPRALHSLVTDPVGTRRALGRLGRLRPVAERLYAYTPWPVLPHYYHPWPNAINQRLLADDVQRALRRLRWRPDVLWTYWPNTAPLLGRLGERCVVYHCIDDFAAAGYPLTSTQTIAAMERRLCERVDLIVARTQALAEAKRAWNPRSLFLPGGVDTARFDPARALPMPPSLAALSPPRLGLVGTLDDRVDYALLLACAQALPQASLILVGPLKGHRASPTQRAALAALQGQANVRLLPPCPPEEAPAYLAAFDVCLIPYGDNAYTRGLSPIKLYEYLAMGKPVVSTPLPYVQREAAHVRLAADSPAFTRAIQEALAHPPDAAQRARWREAALRYSWAAQVDAIEAALQPLLEARP